MVGVSVITAIIVAALSSAMPFVRWCVTPRYPTRPGGAVLITGASSGLGYDTALALADKGYLVYAGVRRDEDKERLLSLDRDWILPLVLDVTSPQQIRQALEVIQRDLRDSNGTFTALINNAGSASFVPLEFHDIRDIERILRTSALGSVELTQAFLPLIRKHQSRIIQVSSVCAILTPTSAGALCASKAALESFTDALRRELRPFKVSVSSVLPGVLKTPALQKSTLSSEKLMENESVRRTYAHLYTPAKKAQQEKAYAKAEGTRSTVKAIVHALESRKPRTRYLTSNINGIPSGVVRWVVWLLPDRVMDLLAS